MKRLNRADAIELLKQGKVMIEARWMEYRIEGRYVSFYTASDLIDGGLVVRLPQRNSSATQRFVWWEEGVPNE